MKINIGNKEINLMGPISENHIEELLNHEWKEKEYYFNNLVNYECSRCGSQLVDFEGGYMYDHIEYNCNKVILRDTMR